MIAAVLGARRSSPAYGVEEFARRALRGGGSPSESERRSPRSPPSARSRPARAGTVAADLFDGGPRRAARAADHLPGALAEAGLLWMATIVALEGAPREAAGPRARCRSRVLDARSDRRPDSPDPGDLGAPEEAFSPTAFALRVREMGPGGIVPGPRRVRLPRGDRGEAPGRALVAFDRRAAAPGLDPAHAGALGPRDRLQHATSTPATSSRVESLRRLSAAGGRIPRRRARFFGNLVAAVGHPHEHAADPVAGYRRFGGDRLQDWDEQSRRSPTSASRPPGARSPGRSRLSRRIRP